MKIVINSCYGGFSISRKCAELMADLGSKQAKDEVQEWKMKKRWFNYYKKNGEWPDDCPEEYRKWLEIDVKYKDDPTFHGYGYAGEGDGYKRDDPYLIQAVETLKKKANGAHAELTVVEIPDDVDWEIEEYDGREWIAEKHRTWR